MFRMDELVQENVYMRNPKTVDLAIHFNGCGNRNIGVALVLSNMDADGKIAGSTEIEFPDPLPLHLLGNAVVIISLEELIEDSGVLGREIVKALSLARLIISKVKEGVRARVKIGDFATEITKPHLRPWVRTDVIEYRIVENRWLPNVVDAVSNAEIAVWVNGEQVYVVAAVGQGVQEKLLGSPVFELRKDVPGYLGPCGGLGGGESLLYKGEAPLEDTLCDIFPEMKRSQPCSGAYRWYREAFLRVTGRSWETKEVIK